MSTESTNGGSVRGASITVVIPTRDRGARIATAIRTIQAGTRSDFELVIVDQSRADETEAAVRQHLSDRRIRYIRSATAGVSAGRNIGIASAQSEIIAITDDDCAVAPTWLEEIESAFRVDPRIGVVFGNVLPCEHDSSAGFVPAYLRSAPFLARGLNDKLDVEGGSACMAVRRSVWEALGGFDEMLGAGAPLRSAAETDFTIRCLLAGHFVYETPAMQVTHDEFLNWEQGRAVVERCWFGTGAMFAKQLKCVRWPIVRLLVRLAWRWAFGRSRFARSLGGSGFRLRRLISFLKGFVAGAIVRADRTTGHYHSVGRRRVTAADRHSAGAPPHPLDI